MKSNKLNEYKKMEMENLEKELKELKQELFKLRFSHAMNVLDNPNKINETKKNIARVNTIITMKKAGKEIKINEGIKSKNKTEKKSTAKSVETKPVEKKNKVTKTTKKETTEVKQKPVKKEEDKKMEVKTSGKK